MAADTRASEGTSEHGWSRWKQVLFGTFKRFSAKDNSPRCAGTAFFGFLSFFPAIATAVLIYGMVADEATLARTIDPVRPFLPSATIEVIESQLSRLAEQPEGSLGIGLLISIPVLLWSASRGVDALLYALSQVRNRPEQRSFLMEVVYAVGFTVGGAIFVVVALLVIAVLPAILALVGAESIPALFLRWPLLFAVTMLVFTVLFRYGPDHRPHDMRYIWPGALLATTLWILASAAFSIYVENWGDYDATFGALSAAAVLMFWMFISAQVLVLGASFNAELERADTGYPPLAPPPQAKTE